MNIHSFKFKTMAYILSVVIVIIAAISVTSFVITYYIINDEINERMPLKLESVITDMERKLEAHSSIVRSLASVTQSNTSSITRTGYINILRDLAGDNQSSFGFGVWFEPYKYSPGIRYFGPYVYRDGEKLIFTDEYETAEYNFHEQEWYLTGTRGVKSNEIAWSVPFYDEASGVTMISAVSPFFSSNGTLAGVASGDFDIVEIQKIVTEIKDESIDMKAFLLDKEGRFLTHEDKSLVMTKKITELPDRNMALLGETILKEKKGDSSVEINGQTRRIYYTELDQTGWLLCVTVSESMLFAPLRKMALATAVVVIISVIASIIISLFIAGRISNPVQIMNSFAGKLAKGDFTERIELNQKDEIGQLARALNTSADSLENLISSVLITSENLAQAVDEISRGNLNLSQRTTQQASALEEIASTIEENSAAVERNAENSRSASELTNQGSIKSEEGSSQARVAIDSINEINTASKKIAEIITVINEIAFQTNLLALNAAVEAARAGEQGRGFAVVAGEVRNLAQRSGDAAKEIEKLIRDSVDKVESGTEIVMSTADTLQLIADAARKSASVIQEIAAASDEQKSAMDQITRAIMELDSMTQQNAALVEETASASEEMTNQAQEMLGLMKQFKINSSLLSVTEEPPAQMQGFSMKNKNDPEKTGKKDITPAPGPMGGDDFEEF